MILHDSIAFKRLRESDFDHTFSVFRHKMSNQSIAIIVISYRSKNNNNCEHSAVARKQQARPNAYSFINIIIVMMMTEYQKVHRRVTGTQILMGSRWRLNVKRCLIK